MVIDFKRRQISERLVRTYVRAIITEADTKEETDEAIEIGRREVNEAIEEVVSDFFSDTENLKFLTRLYDILIKNEMVKTRLLDRVKGFYELYTMLLPALRAKEITPEIVSSTLEDYYNKAFSDYAGGIDMIQLEIDSIVKTIKSSPKIIEDVKKFIEPGSKEIEDAAEAPKDAPLGRIAFAPSRRNKPYEKNTKEEQELLGKLVNHFEGIPLDSKSFNRIKEIMRNDWYQSIFKEAKVKVVYRGISVDKVWLESLTKDKVDDEGSIEISANIGADENVASWSKRKSVAKNFASKMRHGREYSVVMYAKPNDNPNKMLDCDGLYEVDEMQDFESEAEVICFGPAKIYKIEWKKMKL